MTIRMAVLEAKNLKRDIIIRRRNSSTTVVILPVKDVINIAGLTISDFIADDWYIVQGGCVTKEEIVERLYKNIPYPNCVEQLDTSSEGNAVRFIWRGTRFRVSTNLCVEEVVKGGFLAGSNEADLIAALLKGGNMTPSEYFKKPVIGKIVVQDIFDQNVTHIYSFIEKKYMQPDSKFSHYMTYVCNEWYKEHEHIPLLIMNIFVIKEIE